MLIDPRDPAFPFVGANQCEFGMSIRTYLAARALEVIAGHVELHDWDEGFCVQEETCRMAARAAVMLADALILELSGEAPAPPAGPTP